jgi:HAD superfamily hydrolase (TIGR01662 family)
MKGTILVIMGFPASGKTLLAKNYEEQGYSRVNRDQLGGPLDNIPKHVEKLYMHSQHNKFVLDNTYTTIKSRKSVIEWARAHDFHIECIWIDIDIGDALYNATKRMITKYDHILTPQEIKKVKDPSIYPPVVLFKARKSFEPPSKDEGFERVRSIEFQRDLDASIYKNRAILFDYDGTIRKTLSSAKFPKESSDIILLPNRKQILHDYQNRGYILLGISNQSAIANGDLSMETARECFEETNKMLDLEIDYQFCPHPAYPQVCYCRKPMPGMGVYFIEKYKLSPQESIMIGDLKTDKTFAERCGFQYYNQERFFTSSAL